MIIGVPTLRIEVMRLATPTLFVTGLAVNVNIAPIAFARLVALVPLFVYAIVTTFPTVTAAGRVNVSDVPLATA